MTGVNFEDFDFANRANVVGHVFVAYLPTHCQNLKSRNKGWQTFIISQTLPDNGGPNGPKA